MQEITAALQTVTHLEQIVQRGYLLCHPGHHLRWAGKGKVLGEAWRTLEPLRAPPPDLLVLCYSTICQHDPARPIKNVLSPQQHRI